MRFLVGATVASRQTSVSADVRQMFTGPGQSFGLRGCRRHGSCKSRVKSQSPIFHGVNRMAVRLDKPLKREVELEGSPYTVTITPDGVSIVPKGHRKNKFLSWATLLSGDAELTRDLKISLDAFSDGGDAK